jgi:hypothetical protein
MLNVPERPPSTLNIAYPYRSKRLLGAWLGSALGWTEGRVQVKQRGNVLHVLCESSSGPDRATLTARLRSALNTGGFLPQLTPEGAIIHRLVLYGRVTDALKPSWGETFELEMAEEGNQSIVQHLSRQLSLHLSQYNVAVRVKRKAIGETAAYRLHVLCESVYSPDPNVIAEPLAQCLRSLTLRDCQEAIVSGQVKGESEPDWRLRVDLTPADQMLRSRSQWGDVVAMERLLHPLLNDCCQAITVKIETTTLHIVCRHDQIAVPQTYAINRISDFLHEVAPQGIRGASIYGVMNSNGPESPTRQITHWTHWLDLPATDRIDLSPTPEDLIKRGSLTAIGQLITQQLNPDLDQQLATGGIRVQVRQREAVLHIMTDALKIPPQDKIVALIKAYLTPMGIEGVTGLCIYGRRAGQLQPNWQQGLVLGRSANPQRLVPESVPEFTASDSYVEDLMSPPGEIVFVPRQPDRNWGEQVEKIRNGAQWILLKTPFFTPVRVNQRITSTADEKLDGRVAVVWGLLGLCLMITGDWAIGLMLRSPGLADLARQEFTEKSDLKPEPGSFPSLSLNRSSSGSDSSAFNSSEFASDKNSGKASKIAPLNVIPFQVSAKPSKSLNTTPLIDPGLDANLPSSPLQPKAAVDLARSPYPTLNSPQLDERLALYQQYVSAYGVPDVLVVGSSRALRGIDPSALQEDLTQQGNGSLRVFNFGVNGATAQVVDLVLRRLIAPDQLPKIIVWADGARAFNSGRTDITYNAIATSAGYRKLPEQPLSPKTQENQAAPTQPEAPKSLRDRYRALDEMLQSWVNGLSSGGHDRERVITLAREKILGNPIAQPKPNDETNLPLSNEGMTDVSGFLSLSNQFNPATYYQKYSKVPGTFDSDYDSFGLQGKQQDALRNITSFTQARKISLVFVNLPLTREYLDPRRSEYEDEFARSMTEFATELKFTYRDLSRALDQQNALFSDPSHLNRYGAYVVAQRLARDGLMPWRRSDRKN